jgi:hypothetical protein
LRRPSARPPAEHTQAARRACTTRKHDTQPKHEHAAPPTRTCKNSRKNSRKLSQNSRKNSRKLSQKHTLHLQVRRLQTRRTSAIPPRNRHTERGRAVLGLNMSAPPSTPPSAAGRFHGETAHFHGEPPRLSPRPCISKCVGCDPGETAPSHRATVAPSTGARRWGDQSRRRRARRRRRPGGFETAHGEPPRKNSRKNTPCISKCVGCVPVETAPSHRATVAPSTGARCWECQSRRRRARRRRRPGGFETAHFHGEPPRKNSRKNTPCISNCVGCVPVETAPSHRATVAPSTGARRWGDQSRRRHTPANRPATWPQRWPASQIVKLYRQSDGASQPVKLYRRQSVASRSVKSSRRQSTMQIISTPVNHANHLDASQPCKSSRRQSARQIISTAVSPSNHLDGSQPVKSSRRQSTRQIISTAVSPSNHLDASQPRK